jgi:hypothetical protein
MNPELFEEFSRYTDPGEFRHLYDGLPSSPKGISDVVHAQLIHPVAAHILGIELTGEQKNDERSCPSMAKILGKLQERAHIGLSLNRKQEQRVVNNCRGHALFMASVLNSQGVPARLRCGFAPYLPFDFSCDHTVLEAWIGGRWRMIDADATNEFVRSRGYDFSVYDMPHGVFDFGWEAWQRVRQGVDPIERYGIPGGVSGWPFLHTALIRDMLALFGQEIQVWECPPFKDVPEGEVNVTLDRIAELMSDPDEKWDELEEHYTRLDLSKISAP